MAIPTRERWATGDRSGLRFPADAATLLDGGARFLTAAFRSQHALAQDDSVVRITKCQDVDGGSTGRKLLLSVDYDAPGPPRELFVKFSRDFDDVTRDHGRTQMESEVELAVLASADDFPVAVPALMFGDFERSSGTGILITERIAFGDNGIEPQHPKCMDYDMPDQLGHYLALLGAVARVAGMDAAGALPHALTADMEQLSVGERTPLTADQLSRRVDRLVDFAQTYDGMLPANVRSPAFLNRFRRELPRLSAAESAVWSRLRRQDDFVALCHWNANVDNAWFWRDAGGTLQCGLMDWGCAGRMHVAMAVWGAMCSAETDVWDRHLDELLTHFAAELHAYGGRELDVDVLRTSVALYAAVMGMAWLLDVPGHVRSAVPDLTSASTRMDPAIRTVESVRCRLQMLTNVLNVWDTHELGGILDELGI